MATDTSEAPVRAHVYLQHDVEGESVTDLGRWCWQAPKTVFNSVSKDHMQAAEKALTGMGFQIVDTERTCVIIEGPKALFLEHFGVEPEVRTVNYYEGKPVDVRTAQPLFQEKLLGNKEDREVQVPPALQGIMDPNMFLFKLPSELAR